MNNQGSSSVLNSLSCFTNIRVILNEILSENWKMFHSPKKELQSWVQNLDKDLIIHYKFADGIWHLSPIVFYHS